MESLLVPGIISLLVGIGVGLWRKRRKFYRTNASGIEQFNSFSAKVSGTIFDGILHFLSYALATGGVILLAFVYQDSWGWIILLPVFLFMLFLVIGT